MKNERRFSGVSSLVPAAATSSPAASGAGSSRSLGARLLFAQGTGSSNKGPAASSHRASRRPEKGRGPPPEKIRRRGQAAATVQTNGGDSRKPAPPGSPSEAVRWAAQWRPACFAVASHRRLCVVCHLCPVHHVVAWARRLGRCWLRAPAHGDRGVGSRCAPYPDDAP